MMNKALEPAVPTLSKSGWNVKLFSSTSFLNLQMQVGLQKENYFNIISVRGPKPFFLMSLIFAKYLGKTHAMRNTVVHK